ncbi:hypothetical protein M5D96_003284 [Drosophila gunungcola]|uniref:Uncharacterized protein n=1 Tax=Drosophila gunungcola TaxID=103775 RepID=A0A9P9YRZ7_9MUSC|nr:hypothetical protein M5D96_003284 [Drosophila gunungcola]
MRDFRVGCSLIVGMRRAQFGPNVQILGIHVLPLLGVLLILFLGCRLVLLCPFHDHTPEFSFQAGNSSNNFRIR